MLVQIHLVYAISFKSDDMDTHTQKKKVPLLKVAHPSAVEGVSDEEERHH